MRQIVLRGIERELRGAEEKPVRKLQLPPIRSTRKDKLVIDNEKIYELLIFPVGLERTNLRTTVEFPDPVYRELKIRAANEGTTIREIILEGIAMRLRGGSTAAARGDGPRFPVIRSRNPGSLKLGEEGVYEYIPFP